MMYSVGTNPEGVTPGYDGQEYETIEEAIDHFKNLDHHMIYLAFLVITANYPGHAHYLIEIGGDTHYIQIQ